MGLALVGGDMLHKSNFLLLAGAVLSPVVWPEAAQSWSLQTLGLMLTSFKRTYANTPRLPRSLLPSPDPSLDSGRPLSTPSIAIIKCWLISLWTTIHPCRFLIFYIAVCSFYSPGPILPLPSAFSPLVTTSLLSISVSLSCYIHSLLQLFRSHI